MAPRAPRFAQIRDGLARVPTPVPLALLLLAGLWPYASLLGFWPLTTDSALWAMRGSLDNPNWLSWGFAKKHFVFYRPVAAISYTVSFALGGYESVFYRGTDLALHGGVGLVVYALYRRLTGDPRRWPALVAAAFFLAHPVGEEVVPFLARRGYLLMTLCGAASVLVFLRTCRDLRWVSGAGLASGVLLAASLLSTEIDFVLVVIYPLLSYHLCPERDRASLRPLRPALIPMATGALVYAGRSAMLGGDVGGYGNVQRSWERFWSLVPQAIEYPFFPSSALGEPAWMPLGWLGGGIVLGYFAWRAVVRPAFALARESQRLYWLLVAWIVGYVLLPPLFGVWFYRHSYPLLVPLALLVARVFAETLDRGRGGPRWRLALHLLPQAALAVAVLYHSPVPWGLDAGYMASRERKQARMEELVSHIGEIEEPAVVYLVLPFEVPERVDPGWHDPGIYGMHRTGIWAQAFTRGREVEFRDLLYVGPVPVGEQPGETQLEMKDGRASLVFPSGVPLRFTESYVRGQTDLPRLWLDRLPIGDGMNLYVYFTNDERGELVRVRSGASQPR